ncbi:G-protein coupled receptor Mth-like [Corticium candelabrum]|uniref:G-protein coupled receptor Mth-like n=1 Tax=Corticium candelabrum TaxID=121492 RepID=UPI002E257BF4|nr:G-protein coupled receptor Mth-like [Corticium candelabrum]
MWPLDGCQTRHIYAIVTTVFLIGFYLHTSLQKEFEKADLAEPSSSDGILTNEKMLSLDDYSDLLARLSIVGSMASIIACIAIFVTYTCFKSLRSLTGLCLMNKTLVLGLSHCFMLLASDGNLSLILPSRHAQSNSTWADHSNNCKVIAFSLHFLILARFAWSSVLGLQFLRIVAKRRNIENKKKESRRYTRYCIYGWLLPAVVCSMCLIKDLKTSNVYGRVTGETCWIVDQQTNMILFMIPFELTLTINFYYFIRFIGTTHQLLQCARNELRTQKQKDFGWGFEVRLFIGTFFMLGLTGMLEYVMAINKIYRLQNLLTLIQIFQGPTITFTFLLQKAVTTRFTRVIRNLVKAILTQMDTRELSSRDSVDDTSIWLTNTNKYANNKMSVISGTTEDQC